LSFACLPSDSHRDRRMQVVCCLSFFVHLLTPDFFLLWSVVRRLWSVVFLFSELFLWSVVCRPWSFPYFTAIILISTLTFLGSPFTATVSRAGKSPLKYFPYTSFTDEKSDISLKKMVVFTTR